MILSGIDPSQLGCNVKSRALNDNLTGFEITLGLALLDALNVGHRQQERPSHTLRATLDLLQCARLERTRILESRTGRRSAKYKTGAEIMTPEKAPIAIGRIGLGDLRKALKLALRDFALHPVHGMFFGAVYVLGGWLLAWLGYVIKLPFLVYPAAFGFALIAPFIAAGTYEISRRVETGEPVGWSAVLSAVRIQGGRDLGWMALITTFSFYMWVNWAGITYLLFFGFNFQEPLEFARTVFSTAAGLKFLSLGLAAGAVMATVVYSVTVMSFPLLMDRDVDFVTAMITSVRAVIANPVVLGAWALIIGATLLLSIALAFVPLLVTLPVLGHASWHLYRRIVSHREK